MKTTLFALTLCLVANVSSAFAGEFELDKSRVSPDKLKWTIAQRLQASISDLEVYDEDSHYWSGMVEYKVSFNLARDGETFGVTCVLEDWGKTLWISECEYTKAGVPYPRGLILSAGAYALDPNGIHQLEFKR